MEQCEKARAIPKVKFPRDDQVSGQTDMNSRRGFIPEARDLALLGGARIAAGAAEAFDFVVISSVFGAAQVEVSRPWQFELLVAGHRKWRNFAEADAYGLCDCGRRRTPDAQPRASLVRPDNIRAVIGAPREDRSRGRPPGSYALGLA